MVEMIVGIAFILYPAAMGIYQGVKYLWLRGQMNVR